jgi:hypothetical protein
MRSLSYWDPGANTDAGASEGRAEAADPNGTDPPSQNTDGRWVTPSGRVTRNIGSSVQDIRLTDTLTLRGGTCDEGSDRIVAGSGGVRARSNTGSGAARAATGRRAGL